MSICAAIRSFWLVAALLMLLDALSTWYALRLGLYEANPLARWSMRKVGVVPDCILKVLICVPVVWGMAVIADWGIRRGSTPVTNLAIGVLAGTVLLMTAVVTNNLTLIALTIPR